MAGRSGDAAAGLGVPLFADAEPLEEPDRGDSAGVAGDHGGQRDGAETGLPAAADADRNVLTEVFDVVRQIYPQIGLAVYALEPGGPVTLEVHSDGEVYSFAAPTALQAFQVAFPAPPPAAVHEEAAGIFG